MKEIFSHIPKESQRLQIAQDLLYTLKRSGSKARLTYEQWKEAYQLGKIEEGEENPEVPSETGMRVGIHRLLDEGSVRFGWGRKERKGKIVWSFKKDSNPQA